MMAICSDPVIKHEDDQTNETIGRMEEVAPNQHVLKKCDKDVCLYEKIEMKESNMKKTVS